MVECSFAKWLSVCLKTKWLWVRVQLQSCSNRNLSPSPALITTCLGILGLPANKFPNKLAVTFLFFTSFLIIHEQL